MTFICAQCGLTSEHQVETVIGLAPEAIVLLPCHHLAHGQELHDALAQLPRPAPLRPINAPFACHVCGCTRFIELVQYNATNCRLPWDVETNPVTICCHGCKRIYRQTAEWGWSQAEYGYMVR